MNELKKEKRNAQKVSGLCQIRPSTEVMLESEAYKCNSKATNGILHISNKVEHYLQQTISTVIKTMEQECLLIMYNYVSTSL